MWNDRRVLAASMQTLDRAAIETALVSARARTKALLAPLTDEQLTRQVSPLMSPLVWDLAHIGHFEELWLLRRLGGAPPTDATHDDVYDAFAHVRSERSELPLLPVAAARAYVADVRSRTLDLLSALPDDSGDPLLDGGFVFGLVIQHELQHVETMTQTLQLGALPSAVSGPPRVEASGDVHIEAGTFSMGTDPDVAWAYDNERPAHDVTVPAFRMDRALVTNAEYLAFVESGGYDERAVWSEEGWTWRIGENASSPPHWDGGAFGWRERMFDQTTPLDPRGPVQHVSFHEAEAYARFVGRRLPTEAEWEKAAVSGTLEHPTGAVWQWTSSRFDGYPGFRAFPYREYSEVFFGGDYRVLRGGSWVTDPLVARPTFRNWDFPGRRQIFSGIRLATDA